MPSIENDVSSVVWVVVMQLTEPYSQFQAATTLGLPVFVPTASTMTYGPDLDTYGNYVCVVIDEIGNPSNISLLDPHMTGSPPRELLPPLAAFDVLAAVGPSVAPTP